MTVLVLAGVALFVTGLVMLARCLFDRVVED